MGMLDDLFEKKAGVAGVAAGAAGTRTPLLGAALVGGIPGAVGATAGRVLAPQPTDEEATAEAVGEIFDPEHEAELRKIRTQAMLSEFMSTDPVISTYDPDEVATAYNQVVQLAPRTAQQPAVMRGLLRKMLQQQDALEPFEAGQLAEVEERLKKIEEPHQRYVTPMPGAKS